MTAPAPAVRCLPLPQLGLIAAAGDDARSFLQGQLTSDVARLSATQGQIGGYCSPKGRLLAVFTLALPLTGQAIWLSLPQELLAPTLKRLRIFVLRSKLVLTDASEALPAFGLWGEGAEATLLSLGLGVPPESYGTASNEQGLVAQRLPGSTPRYLLRAPAEALARLQQQVPQGTAAAWADLEVLAASPQVFACTVDHFVPQTVDLDLAGGVSFTKGCFPGQEIVARVHYLGRLKARLHLAHYATAEASPGTSVYVAAGDGQAVGEVVLASADRLLLTLNLAHSGSEQLRLRSVDGPALTALQRAHPQAL